MSHHDRGLGCLVHSRWLQEPNTKAVVRVPQPVRHRINIAMNYFLPIKGHVIILLVLLCPATVSSQNVVSDLSGISGALSVMIAALFIASRLKSNIYIVSVRQMAASLLSQNPRLGYLVPQRPARHSEYITDIELTTAGEGPIYDNTPDIALIRTRDVLRINRSGWKRIDNTKVELSKCISNYLPQTRAALTSHPEKMLFLKRCGFLRSFTPMRNFDIVMGHLPHVQSSIVVLEWLMTEAQKDLDSVVAELIQQYNSSMDPNAWNDIVAKALEDLERLTSGQVRCYKIAKNCTDEIDFEQYNTKQNIEIEDWGTSDSGATICNSFFPLVTAYCAALAFPELAFSLVESLNYLETAETLSTKPWPASKQDNTLSKYTDICQTSSRSEGISPTAEQDDFHSYPPGTVTGLVTLLMYAARLPDANSDTLSVVISSVDGSSVNGLDKIDFCNEPNKLPELILDFIQKRADTGGPITRIMSGNQGINLFVLIVRLGLIALVCTGANITPLAALFTADIFGLKLGRYDFLPGEYGTQGIGVRNTEFVVTWHSSKHTHIIASKGIGSVRWSAVIGSYSVAWLCLIFRNTTRSWLGLQSTQVSPRLLKLCGLFLMAVGCGWMGSVALEVFFRMHRLYRLGELHIQRGQRRHISFCLCFRIVGPALCMICFTVSIGIYLAHLWIAGLRTRGMELAIRAVVDVAGIVCIVWSETGVFRILNMDHIRIAQVTWWSTWLMIIATVPFTKE
ncbi:hypothetical protein BDD12DRAFT_807456 [Trichophaea hybrida]|nr:hypothetical protein BDD12DRAFT_807456 [Trichophaea hybrida]